MLKRGHLINGSSCVIKSHGCPFMLEEVLDKGTNGKHWRTGRLMFQIHGKSGWHKITDQATSMIEDKLARIVATIEDSIDRQVKEEIDLARRQAEWREQSRIEEEKKKQYASEIKNFQQLIRDAKRFHEVTLVRAYLLHLATSAARQGEFFDEAVNFVEWGKKKCDWYDPSILAYDTILQENKKATHSY
jgi:hypothetical protein